MTNREWINSLSDDEFVNWLLDDELGYVDDNCNYCTIEPSPKLQTLLYRWTTTAPALRQWLKEKRYDK